MEINELEGAIEGILFASGEAVSAKRIAAVLAVDEELVFDAAAHLADRLLYDRRGIRLVRLDKKLQLCSAPEYSDVIRQTLETRKPPKLTSVALEVLGIVAYFQPVTRAYIDDIRGTDSSYTVGVLAERGLIEPCGTLDAPGRPVLLRTTDNFLRTFGLSSLEELPELPQKGADDAEQIKLQESISALMDEGGASGGEDPERS